MIDRVISGACNLGEIHNFLHKSQNQGDARARALLHCVVLYSEANCERKCNLSKCLCTNTNHHSILLLYCYSS